MSNIADKMTGIHEHPSGLGAFFTAPWNDRGRVQGGGDPVDGKGAAYDLLRAGRGIAVPQAGAGSYREFFRSLGFTEVETYEQSSSAGEWTFCVKDGAEGSWYPAFQSNRYPRHGFEYSVNFDEPYDSFEQFCKCDS